MILLNPVLLAVVCLCVLCLLRVNIMLAMLISVFVGGLTGGLGIDGTLSGIYAGLGSNGETALAYVLLGVYATCLSTTGITAILTKKVVKVVGTKKAVLLFLLTVIAVCSQNIVPVHIAYIMILFPPLLPLMNQLRLDRRAVACCTAYGLKMPYLSIPFGFGLIFMGIIRDNVVQNAQSPEFASVTVGQIVSVNWILGLAMTAGLLIALLITYRKPRDYNQADDPAPGAAEIQAEQMGRAHWFSLVSIVVVVAVQLWKGSLPFAALCGLLVLFVTGSIRREELDDQFHGGIRLMGFIAVIMLVAGGFAQVLKDTGAVDQLVSGAISVIGGSRLIAAAMITLIGLLVTMGIGTSFGTIPVIAVIYVPLCEQIGFSPAATILLISAAAALGDAGSPASDTTLGPTSGLNADGQHDHIWDTCVPTFLHFNIPLMLAAVLASQVL